MKRRRYSPRITPAQREAMRLLYAPDVNQQDALSHSPQCDEFFSIPSPEIGGVPHVKCLCWCHHKDTLFATPEPEYDLTPPPEYANSADAAFIDVAFRDGRDSRLLLPGVSISEPMAVSGTGLQTVSEISLRYPGRSAHELAVNKCDTCGDPLAECECVE